jgi:hypothetical protein
LIDFDRRPQLTSKQALFAAKGIVCTDSIEFDAYLVQLIETEPIEVLSTGGIHAEILEFA